MNRRGFLAGIFGAAAATCGAVSVAEAMPALPPDAALAVGPHEEIEQIAMFGRRRRRVFVRRRRRFFRRRH